MFSQVKSATLRHELQTDKVEPQTLIEDGPNKSDARFRHKKFAILGTKISESSDFLSYDSNERFEKILEDQDNNSTTPKATEILSRILQNNLNHYNHLINYNYKHKSKNKNFNYDDEIRNNRLNFLLGMQKNEKMFAIRPASLNDLNERLGKIYASSEDRNKCMKSGIETENQARMINSIYNIRRKQQVVQAAKSAGPNRPNGNNSGVKNLGLVDFNDQLDL